MNVIGVFAPKIVSFFVVLFSSVPIKNKAIFLAIWLLKLIIDYDAAKPSHSGTLYKLVKNLEFENQTLFVNCICSIPAVAFLIIAVRMHAWVLCVLGAISVIARFVSIVCCVKDVFTEYRRRREKCK